MTDFRTMYDKEHIGAWDLDGREVTVTIESVKAGKLVGQNGKADKKAIIKFVGKEKTFACNITNARIIAGMYGTKVEDWAGKRIAIYPTTTQFGRDTVECIRVRNKVPDGKAAPQSEPREPGEEG